MAERNPGERAVRVKVVADQRFIERDPRWHEGARHLVEAASDYFEGEFGIRLVVQSVGPWVLKEKLATTASMLTALKENFPLGARDGSYDLLIALSGERINVYVGGRGRVDRIGNCQEGLGSYVVSYISKPFRARGEDSRLELDVQTLVHELGHVFGAEHTQDTSSIMHVHFDYRFEFDNKSRETILKNKFCSFGK